jgi:hypothetical protein
MRPGGDRLSALKGNIPHRNNPVIKSCLHRIS